MKINRKKLHKLYIAEVNRICDVCDWKTHFGPEEIVHLVADVIDKNNVYISDKQAAKLATERAERLDKVVKKIERKYLKTGS